MCSLQDVCISGSEVNRSLHLEDQVARTAASPSEFGVRSLLLPARLPLLRRP